MAVKCGNILASVHSFDDADPAGYRAGAIEFEKGATGDPLAVKSFELPAGETLCPYHYEYVEEWLIVLEGKVTVRVPDGEEEGIPGDVMRFPAGPEGAHQVSNPTEATARLVMFSSAREPSVAVYPDSDKIGVWAGSEALMLKRADGNVDYYDGEA
jgi:uncharacterized cupin superfamily protein